MTAKTLVRDSYSCTIPDMMPDRTGGHHMTAKTPKATPAPAQTPVNPPMMDAEGNVNVICTDGSSWTLQEPTGLHMERIELAAVDSGSQVRGMCAAIAVLTLEPLTVDDVLAWNFQKITEVANGLKTFPVFANGF